MAQVVDHLSFSVLNLISLTEEQISQELDALDRAKAKYEEKTPDNKLPPYMFWLKDRRTKRYKLMSPQHLMDAQHAMGVYLPPPQLRKRDSVAFDAHMQTFIEALWVYKKVGGKCMGDNVPLITKHKMGEDGWPDLM